MSKNTKMWLSQFPKVPKLTDLNCLFLSAQQSKTQLAVREEKERQWIVNVAYSSCFTVVCESQEGYWSAAPLGHREGPSVFFTVLFMFPQFEIPKALDSNVFVYFLIWTPEQLLILITVFSCI